MTKTIYHFAFQSQIANVKKVLFNVMTYIKEEFPDMADDLHMEIRLMFSELLNNAVIHGNMLDTSKWVQLSITISNDGITSAITDEGSGFDYAQLLNSISHSGRETVECEHGRGLKIVSMLADSFRFNAKGNEVVFSKKVL